MLNSKPQPKLCSAENCSRIAELLAEVFVSPAPLLKATPGHSINSTSALHPAPLKSCTARYRMSSENWVSSESEFDRWPILTCGIFKSNWAAHCKITKFKVLHYLTEHNDSHFFLNQ